MAGRETPATKALKDAGVPFTLHEYAHDPQADSYATEAADALGLDPDRVFKTLVVQAGDELAVAIVPASAMLDLKAIGKRAAMADPTRAERVTGYVKGGISPLGQRRALPTHLDETAHLHDTIYVSAGRRGLEIQITPDDLIALTNAVVKDLATQP